MVGYSAVTMAASKGDCWVAKRARKKAVMRAGMTAEQWVESLVGMKAYRWVVVKVEMKVVRLDFALADWMEFDLVLKKEISSVMMMDSWLVEKWVGKLVGVMVAETVDLMVHNLVEKLDLKEMNLADLKVG